MGRSKRNIPMGYLRMVTPKNADASKEYPIYYYYTWNGNPIKKTTGVKCLVKDFNPKGNRGRGELRPSHGQQWKHKSATLIAKLDRIDAQLLEFNEKYPNRITKDVIRGFLFDEPITRIDKGQDFVDFAMERLKSKFNRKKIGESRFQNGKSALNMFRECLATYNLGTHKSDGIYLAEITAEIIDKFIDWKRNIKNNTDETINHALSPILSACDDACKKGIISHDTNSQIQEMRIAIKPSLDEDEKAFDGKFLSKVQFQSLIKAYINCKEPRRKEYLEMFLFAFLSCGLRMVDVVTLQWSNINFDKKEMKKVLVKTKNRHIVPLTQQAISILENWHKKTADKRFVFGLLSEDFDLNDEELLDKRRNSINKSINQSLKIVGQNINLPFSLTMHVARHSFAVFALNDGMSMSMVSRLLGHSSTDITEKVYARYLPETLADEVAKLNYDFLPKLD